MTFAGYRQRILAGLGLAPRAATLAFLEDWARCEGGTARFNPFNTTLQVHGSTRYNSVGVQHYQDAIEGTAATLLTLRLAAYEPLRRALADERLDEAGIIRAAASSLTTWGTGSSCLKERARARRAG